ncbi:methyltransferase domain-containing protein [Streptomyces roseirectus]|uniref:Methyltransferase domain-containing protein n=1 Tax=Streptomyces roseirectus TaxID=2768066 RepID=A0A7H0IGH9_9ACTN|nr:methyltransferase domain-containing protein [Streptomyces roseirectus]QNP71895.1 methyltransferase domain-containing protein [Streptomyces roseirectus]
MDWHEWHNAYDNPDSYLARRLVLVKERIREALDAAPEGEVGLVSLCAGQGRDVIEVVAEHPRRRDVRARLVELDARNAEFARRLAERTGLGGVEVVAGDASLTDHYVDVAPADVVVLCGVLGNVVDADVRRIFDYCTALCRPGGTLVWTRTRHYDTFVGPWLEEREFEAVWVSGPEVEYGVGAHRYRGDGKRLMTGERMFEFVGYDVLRNADRRSHVWQGEQPTP